MFYTVIFGLCGIVQVAVGIKSRVWTFMTALVIGAFMEMIGYIGRILMNQNPWNERAFEQQITCLILAPSFVAAGIYWSVKHITIQVSPSASKLPPRLYPWIFIWCDIGSIILQAAGGGVAASAGSTDTKLLNAGNDIMIAGIAFQVATMVVCGCFVLDFVIRAYRRRGSIVEEKTKTSVEESTSEERTSEEERTSVEETSGGNKTGFYIFCAAWLVAYLTVLTRCIYRYGTSSLFQSCRFCLLCSD